jgi:hypothetical protein
MGIVAGACIALALAGAVGVTTFADTGDEGRTVGTWHDAPSAAPTTAAVEEPTAPVAPARAESGRERVGTVQQTTSRIAYGAGPQRRAFHHPRASYVKLHFDRLALLPGDYVTVGDGSGGETYRYDGLPAGRWAMSVTGDTAVLELHRAAGRVVPRGAPGPLGVGVDRVARGHTPAERATTERAAVERATTERAAARHATGQPVAPGRTGREETVCGSNQSVDAACYRSADPVAFTRSRAIARLLINGTELCTGWRVSARNRMVTNNHCFDTSAEAYRTEVWFNYQCTTCGGAQALRPTKVWGEKVLVTHRTYDFTLFTVEHFDRVQKFGYLTIDLRRPLRGEQLYVPQHPGGQPARIAGARGETAGNCAVVDPEYDGYAANTDVSYYCDTEGGSSGSPVLSRGTDKVVALHHFGGCPNSGVRADLLYSRIKKLL